MGFDNRLIIDCFANVENILIWLFSSNDRFRSEKYESNYLENPFPEMKGVNSLSKTHRNDKSNLNPKTVLQEKLHVDRFSWRTKPSFFSSHSIQLKTCSACVLVAGTQRFFLAGVAKYCSVSQDVTHNELCKWLNKNGPPKNFAKRGTEQLFLYYERKNSHFVTRKDENNEYSEKSWALFDKSFC